MNGITLRFPCPAKPLSINASSNWAKKRRYCEPWKQAAFVVARNHLVRERSTFAQTPVNVQVVIPFRGHHRRDPHNYTGTVVKAVVDGLVRAGIVPDDHAGWVTVIDPVLIVPDRTADLIAEVRITPRKDQTDE